MHVFVLLGIVSFTTMGLGGLIVILVLYGVVMTLFFMKAR